MIKIILAAVGLAIATPPANASTQIWRTVGDWYILTDASAGGACFAARVYEGLLTFRVGFHPEVKMYFGVGNPNWNHIKPGSSHNLLLTTESMLPWHFKAVGGAIGEVEFVFSSFDSGAFLHEITTRNSVTVKVDEKIIGTLSLSGSKKAVDSMLECQAVVDGFRSPPNPNGNNPAEKLYRF